MSAHWGDSSTFGFARKLLHAFHKARKAVTRPMITAFRASWAYREWVAHMHTCRFVDPASKTNARCWSDTSSNLRAVYDAMVTHRPALPPRVAHVYLKQRRVVYHSVMGPVEMWVRPKAVDVDPCDPCDGCDECDGRVVVVAHDGLRFATQVPRWMRCAWAVERVAFAVVDRIARSLVGCRRREHHDKRSSYSRTLYRLS